MQLRSAFADSTGRVRDDLTLEDQDEVRDLLPDHVPPAEVRRRGGWRAAGPAGCPTATG